MDFNVPAPITHHICFAFALWPQYYLFLFLRQPANRFKQVILWFDDRAACSTAVVAVPFGDCGCGGDVRDVVWVGCQGVDSSACSLDVGIVLRKPRKLDKCRRNNRSARSVGVRRFRGRKVPDWHPTFRDSVEPVLRHLDSCLEKRRVFGEAVRHRKAVDGPRLAPRPGAVGVVTLRRAFRSGAASSRGRRRGGVACTSA